MFSPTAAHHTFVPPLTPSLAHYYNNNSPIASPNLAAAHSPNPSGSPYRLPPLPRPSSGGDLVSGIVDKFNSLSVTDRQEEDKARSDRQMAKLDAALQRAVIAREEAESEARQLRQKLLEVQDERVRERECLRERCAEFEKKYEKAKERFKLQRLRNEEAMHAVKMEFLEKEKEHWRNVAVAQEAEEWERKLRVEASELIEFVELERRFEADSDRRRWTTPVQKLWVKEKHEIEVREVVMGMADEAIEVDEEEEEEEAGEKTIVVPEVRQRRVLEEVMIESRPMSSASNTAPSEQSVQARPQSSQDSLREVTPEGPPSMPIRPFATPARQVVRVPVNFDDAEDKENMAPSTVAEILKTPMTMDRAAALAAIEYRRGRAKSFMNAQMTPKTLALADKRDVSAPAMVTMTVGRKR